MAACELDLAGDTALGGLTTTPAYFRCGRNEGARVGAFKGHVSCGGTQKGCENEWQTGNGWLPV